MAALPGGELPSGLRLPPDARREATGRAFRAAWADDLPPAPAALRDACEVILVRGLFGAWIPGHFRAPLARLRSLGWRASIARTDPSGTVERNRQALLAQLDACVAAGRAPLVLAHSKGGVEALLALLARPALARATAGFVGVQMPRAGAPYLESVFNGRHRASRRGGDALRETAERTVLSLAGARAACAELDGPMVARFAARIDREDWPFPRLNVATWSTRATRSLELRHERLERIAPGAPHDGVFRTVDQLWPGADNLLLAGVDHAQPSVGGLGFAHDRFWCVLLRLLVERADWSGTA